MQEKILYPIYESFKDKLKPSRSKTQLALAQTNIFSRLSWREIKVVEQSIHLRTFAPNEAIFNQGDPGNGMYIIVKGSVGIFLDIPHQEAQKLTELHEGDFFGEMALLDEAPRSAAALALEQSIIIGFYRPDLLHLLKTKPSLGSKILLSLSEVLAARLRSTNEELVKVSRKLNDLEEQSTNE